MSSYDAKPEARGEDLQNLAMQWGYLQNHSQSRNDSEREISAEFGKRVLNFLNPIFCAVATLAGAGTTIAAVAWLSGYLVF